MPEIEQDSGIILPETGENSSEKVLFGKYEVGRLLGCGAFAKVYHARNIRTGQSVAIKAISKHKIVKGGLMGHIKREITIMRLLRHPHIVRLFEVLATKTKIYFVMEFVKGGELFAKVAKGRFSEDLSRRYFQQLISAIGYCHSHGVFHRDLKPENLLVDDNGDLKVSDFGLSALTGQIRNDGLLHTLCGTPAYVAPEILAKRGYDGAKVDIWSCGIILYVLNAGYLPFNDPNLMVMYRKIYKGEFRCPKWTSPDLRRFLSRLLDTNPETRITVDEILEDPWFKRGYKEVKFHEADLGLKAEKDEGIDATTSLNAFDIISFSPGLDLSGLFDYSGHSLNGERFVSGESIGKIIEKIEEVAKRENVTVARKKEWKMELEGQNGNFQVEIEVYQLTENLVVLEVKKVGGDEGSYDGIWREKLRPELSSLIYYPETTFTEGQNPKIIKFMNMNRLALSKYTCLVAQTFEWAWQHPTESLAVRKAAASLKSLSGIANKIKLAYTMLTLPAWQSLNLTVNFFSTKYTKHSAGCPSLPEQMKVQVCSMEELPCYTECGQTLYENEDNENGDSEDDDENGHLKERLTDLSVYNVAEYNCSFEKIAHEQSGWIEDDGFRQPRESPLTPIEDHRLPSRLVNPLTRTPSSRDMFGLIEESIGEMLTPKAADNYRPPSTNVLLSSEIEVINILSPDCLIRSCRKKKRASSVFPEIIDLTKSPVFIQL
ncbi:hypothetical protein HHK36_018657 [Tetracentron sinense]|uniref:non-specific serine/threonine protein kinase n=1 Tax=Tetracentron sinense TaxID=13715 RepID=A0A834YW95_TETSI|nr:hypothetical protein HHK36_018657 [Tetracentron sinense]